MHVVHHLPIYPPAMNCSQDYRLAIVNRGKRHATSQNVSPLPVCAHETFLTDGCCSGVTHRATVYTCAASLFSFRIIYKARSHASFERATMTDTGVDLAFRPPKFPIYWRTYPRHNALLQMGCKARILSAPLPTARNLHQFVSRSLLQIQ